MIKSMTGFGRAEYTDGKRNITIEIRSVNHRYCDISVKMPRRYSFVEDKIKKAIKETANRGKIEVSVLMENLTEADTVVKLNTAVAEQYYENLLALKEAFGMEGEITLEYLASLPDVLKAIPDVEDEEEITNAILTPVREAAANLDSMRAVEGVKLAEDILGRGQVIEGYVKAIEARAESVPKEYTEKLRNRIQELIGGSVEVPEDRILVEAAIFADKCNIDEELTRLYSHITQLGMIINSETEADGKKLDFLVQEMNREANTIGSKANDLEITNYVLKLKAEIEKIREQVQNVE